MHQILKIKRDMKTQNLSQRNHVPHKPLKFIKRARIPIVSPLSSKAIVYLSKKKGQRGTVRSALFSSWAKIVCNIRSAL